MARLLIIEDNENDIQLLNRKLCNSFILHLARTLAQAKDVIEHQALDAVLVDLGLPDSERDKTMRTVKAMCPSIAIVVISGSSDPDFITKTIAENASNYLVKGVGDKTTEMLAGEIRIAINNNLAICHFKNKAA